MTTRMGVAVAALLLLAAPLAAAKAAYSEQNDRLVLGNEQIQLSLQGKKPLLQVSDPQNASRGYQLFLQRIVEIPPGGATQGGDVVASFDLQRAAAWDVNHTQDANGITVTMTRTGEVNAKHETGKPSSPVPLPPQVENITSNVTGNASANATYGNVTVTLAFHLFDQVAQVQSGNSTVNVTTHEVKFDLDVQHWPWINPADVLALEFQLSGEGAASPATTGGSEVAAQQDGQRVGWVSWASQAQAWGPGNDTAPRNVTVEHRVNGNSGQGAEHWLVYDAPGATRIVHDPSAGLDPSTSATSSGKLTPGLGTLALLGVAGIAALAARRKR